MHTFSENSSGVPAFLAKLWRLVEDEETNNLIYWSTDGKSFIIQNQAQFAREILPLNYKHNNMASFIRQLNMYGFHKITSLDGGGLKFDRDEMEFSHPYFQRDHPYLLDNIKRKISSNKSAPVDDKTNVKHEIVSKVLSDVKAMKGRQDSLDNRFLSIKQENEALWREVALLRQKHMKQQQIVNKLIQFLVTIVQPQRGSGIGSMSGMSGVKRRYQLMINDIPDAAKVRKTSNRSGLSLNEGPVIHELTEELLDTYVDGDEEMTEPYVLSPGSIPQNTINDPIETIDDVDPDKIITQDVDLVDTNIGIDNNVKNVYNTNNFDSDLIYNTKSELITIPGTSGGVTNIPDELLANVSNANQIGTFIKKQIKSKQPIIIPAQQAATTNSKIIPKIQVPANIILANKNNNGQGVKIPLVKMASNQTQQIQQIQQPASILKGSTSGKSLIDAQKLKVAKQQVAQQQQQQQQQQVTQQFPVIQTIPQAGNKPILITVGKVQLPKSGQLTNVTPTAKTYKNKDDFISSEIPNELFQDENSQEQFNENNLLDADNSQKMNVCMVNDNFNETTSIMPNNPGTSGIDTTDMSGKDLTVAKYKKNSNDDVMRIMPEDLNQHLETVQGELEALKEFLRGSEDYQLDANTLINLFAEHDVLQQCGIPQNPTDTAIVPGIEERQRNQNESPTGSELVSYQQQGQPIDFTDFLNLEDNQLTMSPSDAANMTTPNIQQMLCTNAIGDLSTPSIKQEQFCYPK